MKDMPEQDEAHAENVIEELSETEPVEIDPNGKYVALTFDDGPSPQNTPKILKALENHQAKATFFMLGSQVKHHPDIAKTVAEAGHEIANHTYNHLDLKVIDHEQAKEEIGKTRKVIHEVTGYDSTLVRPPYGSFNESIVNQAIQMDESLILWSVDSLDWKSRHAPTINQTILREVTSGSVVLMHDIHAETAEAIPQLLEKLEADGYQFVTVSQLLTLQEKENVKTYFGVMR